MKTYQIVDKSSNSFGDIEYKVQLSDGSIHTLSWPEGCWPDALQVNNACRSLCCELIGE